MQVLQRAQALRQQGQLEQALFWADSAAARVDDLADIHLLRGQVQEALKQYSAADAAYAAALTVDPAYYIAAYHRGNVAFQRERYDAAIDHYLTTLGLDSWNTGVSATRLEARLGRVPLTTTLLQLGRAYDKLGDAPTAREVYAFALRIDEARADLHGDLAALYRDDGDIDRALDHALRATQLDSLNLDYAYILGTLLVQHGAYEEAIAPLRRVVTERPWQTGVHYNLGQALLRTGSTEQGQRYLALADTLQPLLADVRRLEILVERRPDLLARWLQLAEGYAAVERYEKAIEAMGYALRLAPESANVWTQLADYYVANNQPEQARRVRQRASR
ncbi:MAG: hypothetical protein RhofKO_35240 [Rhodothermales bacterium]